MLRNARRWWKVIVKIRNLYVFICKFHIFLGKAIIVVVLILVFKNIIVQIIFPSSTSYFRTGRTFWCDGAPCKVHLLGFCWNWRIFKRDDSVSCTTIWQYKQKQWTYCSYKHSYAACILLLVFGINPAALRRQWPTQPCYTDELCSFQENTKWVLVVLEELLLLTSPALDLKWMYHPEGNLHQSRLLSERKRCLYLRSTYLTFISCCCLLTRSLAQGQGKKTKVKEWA